MAQVNVSINNKTYRMACNDGEEDHLRGLAVRLNGPAAAGIRLAINLELTDPTERRLIELRRSVLHSFADRRCAVTGAVVSMAAGCCPRTVVATW